MVANTPDEINIDLLLAKEQFYINLVIEQHKLVERYFIFFKMIPKTIQNLTKHGRNSIHHINSKSRYA